MPDKPNINLEELNPINDLLDTVLKAINEWKSKNTEEVLTQRVHDLLDKNAKEVVLKLLGFNESWGKWEVDHCNGRAGESAVGDYLKRVKQSAIDSWLAEAELPKMDKTISTIMRKELKHNYDRFLKQYLYEYAQDQARETAQEIIKSVFSTTKADAVLKVAELLQVNKD